MEREVLVSGTLATVLRVSRLGCAAPLHFGRQRGGSRVSVSRWLHVCGCAVVTFMNAVILTATIMDLQKDPENSIRMQSSTRRAVWLLDMTIMMSLVGYGAFAAPRHLTAIMYCLNCTQQISIELNTPHWPKRGEYKMLFFISAWSILTVSITLNDHMTQMVLVRKQPDLELICILYSFYYLCYWIMQLLIFQFVLIVLQIRRSFINISNKLKSLEQEIDSRKYPAKPAVFKEALNRKRKKSVNSIIDSMAFVGKVKAVDVRPTHEKVRHLALTYVSACQIVRKIDQKFGVMLVLLLASFLLHMTITPYYLINHVFSSIESRGTFYVLSQCVWCFYHIGCLVMVIEPCHLTLQEVAEIRCQISLLMRLLSSPVEPLALELNMFFKHLTLNEVSYSPLRITTLTRGLVATIISTIITYLVVIIQL